MLKNDIVDIKHLTKIFNITRNTLYDWIREGLLPAPYKMKCRVYWKKSEIEELINKKKH